MKAQLSIFTILFILILCISCSPSDTKTSSTEGFDENMPAEGFDISGSDPQAIKVADDVMMAMGGRKNWDETRYIAWNFFGARKHLWDKWTGDVRIEAPRDSTIILMNINTMEGRVSKRGEVFEQPDSVKKYLDRGKAWWINDSYWLVMPFKLKDTGVTLKYVGEDTTADGRNAHVLTLKFKEVGVTPENGYEVFVDIESKLVSQWSYYRNADQEDPNFTMPWLDYKQYGNILLSGNRGERQITEIKVLEKVPEGSFTAFEATVL